MKKKLFATKYLESDQLYRVGTFGNRHFVREQTWLGRSRVLRQLAPLF